jgi:hypothetical protein
MLFSYRHICHFTTIHKNLAVCCPKLHLNLELRLMPLPALEQPDLDHRSAMVAPVLPLA